MPPLYNVVVPYPFLAEYEIATPTSMMQRCHLDSPKKHKNLYTNISSISYLLIILGCPIPFCPKTMTYGNKIQLVEVSCGLGILFMLWLFKGCISFFNFITTFQSLCISKNSLDFSYMLSMCIYLSMTVIAFFKSTKNSSQQSTMTSYSFKVSSMCS